MELSLSKQLQQIELQEQKLLNSADNAMIQAKISPLMTKVQSNIPDKLKGTLNTAFYKGFQLVFEKGTAYIEKTYNREKIELEYDINNYAIDKKATKKHIKRLDRYSKQTKLLNSSISAIEGSVLGLLGVGLPDIPLFISVLMKTIYEIALSYGYAYDSPEERAYILLLIRTIITKGEKQKELHKQLEEMAEKIDSNAPVNTDLTTLMKDCSNDLAEALLTAKFIQGIPIVGIIGGAVNYSIVNSVAKFARLKYKKRYLRKKLTP
jgi:hypothetical protein